MSLNHRILAHQEKDDVFFQIHEVFYDKNGKPDGYTAAVSVGGLNLKDIIWTLNKMKKCIKKPILWAGENFPNEYKIKL